jgi:U3 small nucleolar ribonucleoprotein protein LCP5
MRSSRARAVQRYNEFEEENFTRLVMKKKDMKRRVRDEEDLALGADLSGKGEGRRRKGGFEGEFDDVLRDVAREGGRGRGDGYEELRNKAKKKDVLGRSRVRSRDEAFEDGDGGDNVGGARDKKKGRFQKETKIVKRKMAKSRR